MLLSEIFDQLTYGELKQLDMGGDDGGAIDQKDYPQVVAHVNLGLTELYKRFPIKMRTVTIEQDASIGTYFLDSTFSAVDGTASTLYLIDTVADRFIDNVLKVEKIRDVDGDLLDFNDANSITSINTYDYNAISIPNPVTGTFISVEYRADHDPISPIELDPTTVEVKLPRSLLASLLQYVGYRAYATTPPIDGVDRSGQYLAKFEAGLTKLVNLDLINDVEKENQKLWNNGWP